MDKMIDEMIETMYNDLLERGEYTDLPETVEASRNTYALYWDNPKFEDIRYELENAIGQESIMREKQSFIYGFKKAMEIFSKEVL